MAEIPRGGERFPTTQWSLVARAGAGDDARRREALETVLTTYLPAMKAHLLHRKGLRPERADDLLQEFVADKVLQKNLIAQANHELGRFRTFLLTALDRFLINRLRDERARKRAPGAPLAAFDDHADAARCADRPGDAFDLAWARQVIDEALRRMQAACESACRPDLWGVFYGRVAGPILEGTEPLDYGHLVRQFGLASPSQATNALVTAKRMYVRMLREVIGQYARDDVEIEGEIDDLHRVLAGSKRA
jgi:DNA-directed RNA polymerase specialized sigma24 family protein